MVTMWWQNSACCHPGPLFMSLARTKRKSLWERGSAVYGRAGFPRYSQIFLSCAIAYGHWCLAEKEVAKCNFLAGMLLPYVVQVREQGWWALNGTGSVYCTWESISGTCLSECLSHPCPPLLFPNSVRAPQCPRGSGGLPGALMLASCLYILNAACVHSQRKQTFRSYMVRYS